MSRAVMQMALDALQYDLSYDYAQEVVEKLRAELETVQPDWVGRCAMSREAMQLALNSLETEAGIYISNDPEDGPPEEMHDAIVALRTELEKPDTGCGNCANRGRIEGLSQETHCDRCIRQEHWRTDHYRKEDVL